MNNSTSKELYKKWHRELGTQGEDNSNTQALIRSCISWLIFVDSLFFLL